MNTRSWFLHSPGRLAGCWFACFRLVWALGWFSLHAQPRDTKNWLVSSLVPIGISTLAAAFVGSRWGTAILNPDLTRSVWMAGLRGFLIQHATTLVYLPLAVLLRCLIVGELSRFWPSLYISLMINLSGVPIHTLLGFLTGVTLWYAAPKLNRHPQ